MSLIFLGLLIIGITGLIISLKKSSFPLAVGKNRYQSYSNKNKTTNYDVMEDDDADVILGLKGNTIKEKNPIASLELLLESAYQLAEDLGGDVCDEQKQPLTAEKISELRAKLNYEDVSPINDDF